MIPLTPLSDILPDDSIFALPNRPAINAHSKRKPLQAAILLKGSNGYVKVILPDAVDPGDDGRYADVRLRDGTSKEIPYVLDMQPTSSTPHDETRLVVRQAELVRSELTERGTTEFLALMAQPHVAVCAVQFTKDAQFYSRHVMIETSDDQQNWNVVTEGTISHFQHGEDQSLFDFQANSAKYWRMRIENGNDAPLRHVKPLLLGPEHAIVFAAQPQRAYHLEWGTGLAAPTYDFADQLAHEDWHIVGSGTLNAVSVVPPSSYARLFEQLRNVGIQKTVLQVVAALGTAFLLFWSWRMMHDPA